MVNRRPDEHIVEHQEYLRVDLIKDGESGTTAIQADKGHVWVEWVGEPSPFDSLGVQWMMLRNRLSKKTQSAIRAMAVYGTRRSNGCTDRVLTPSHVPGMSKEYHWGPNWKAKPGDPFSYIQIASHADAELIKACSSGHEFRVLGLAEQDPDPIEEATKLLVPDVKVIVTSEQSFSSFRAFEESVGWRNKL